MKLSIDERWEGGYRDVNITSLRYYTKVSNNLD